MPKISASQKEGKHDNLLSNLVLGGFFFLSYNCIYCVTVQANIEFLYEEEGHLSCFCVAVLATKC